ncbi:PucR C-terminal helix-turn-helix domain-containing protein [Streptomyces sp. cf386]|uniref:helix-turn-helix domain-containing protein n=1 Tax=Streptomyces sp. cf386 TaxID=1761904 RepID=UPI00089216A6|nr:helix-turn-helix domain-containing protein [Streptomyces sp. cf386]SDO37403.1 PucR C-terminal helix-turn-helix domain-containing protein [Streptomyces sp. cf386]
MPEPAVPPTPPVPLSALLAREDLALRQIAGPTDPDTVIHWAHTSEMADPYPYLLGGELLLTAGVHIPEAAGSGTYFDDYVARIVEAGGAALGFGVAPVHDTVPRALVAACELYELPLLEVPPQTTFSGVARAVWQLMAQARLAELRRVTEAQQSLAAAASRPDPVRAVLRQLAQRVGGWAVLYGPEGARVASAGRAPVGVGAASVGAGAGSVGAGAGSVGRAPGGAGALSAGRTPEATGAATAGRAPEGVGAASAGRAPEEAGAPSAGRAPEAAGAASLKAGAASAGAGAGAASAGASTVSAGPTPEATEATSAGRTPEEAGAPSAGRAPEGAGAPSLKAETTSAEASAAPAGRTPEATGAAPTGRTPSETVSRALAELVEVVRPSGPGTPTSATDSVSGIHLAAYALGAGQGFVLGVAAPQRDPGDHTIASVAAVLLSLLTGEHQSGSGAARSSALVRLLLGAEPQAVAPLLGEGSWLVVHARPDSRPGDPVAASALGAALGSPFVDLARDVVRVLVPADREPSPQPGWTLGVSAPATAPDWPAADTQASRALSRARATRTPLFQYGTRRPALTDLLSPDEAQTHARTLLAPLSSPLTETLRTWLSLHGSWDRTAVALSVHRNTVRQRIARCGALLGTDLDDPDVRMELWFALRHIEG